MPSATAPRLSGCSSTQPSTPINPDPAGFGVYIHWPFCASKCPYCDFNSHVRQRVDETRMVAGIRRELGFLASRTGPRTVGSIFFGGGTPSLMQPASVEALIGEVSALWDLEPGAEITLEANPGSVEADRFAGFRSAGVNRVSIGVQSLRPGPLAELGRLHSVDEAKAAITVARRTFDRFSFDLIYARPGQSAADWRNELAEALALAGEHLSLYQLTIEEGTPFARLHGAGKLAIPDPDLAADLYALTGEMTSKAGMGAYEVSNYAAPGQESRHNLLYWRYGEYAGAGPGAHGRPIVEGRRWHSATERSPERWMELVESKGQGFTEFEPLDRATEADEALLMGLRVAEGLPLARLARFGATPDSGTVAGLVALGLLEAPDRGRLTASAKGRLVLNSVVAELSRTMSSGDPESRDGPRPISQSDRVGFAIGVEES